MWKSNYKAWKQKMRLGRTLEITSIIITMISWMQKSDKTVSNIYTCSCILLTCLHVLTQFWFNWWFFFRSKKRGILPALSELTNFHGKKKKDIQNGDEGKKISETSEEEMDISDHTSTDNTTTDTGETGQQLFLSDSWNYFFCLGLSLYM